MAGDFPEEAEHEILASMWPADFDNEGRRQFNMEKHNKDSDMFEDVKIVEEPSIVDFKRLLELTDYSKKGSTQLAFLVKQWGFKQANVARLLNEELDILSKQRHEVELKKQEILEEHRFEEEKYVGDKRCVSIWDEIYDVQDTAPAVRNDVGPYNRNITIDAECDDVKYWKQRAMQLDKLLEESIRREQAVMQKLEDNVNKFQTQESPVEELSQILKRADNFVHFVLQNAPIVFGHQDKDLRYRFIYNHFPRLEEEDIIGKTDTEIFSGAGVDEIQEFKREVLDRGLPAKREIAFETDLFGLKTFLIYVEPVFSKAGETLGINYVGMDVTDQVAKREKMAKLREEIAVQKAKETELNKTIHITEETMRAKQMLATMSHEIRSPLTGVVSMAEILANTKLDEDQRQLLNVMLSSGDLVIQLINDILDLSKVESGAMKLEAAKFRPREVVKHVLQTAAACLKKDLTLEGHVTYDVPTEVIGDVLRIRQILTNLISNAVKFTHEGKVGIKLHVVLKKEGIRHGSFQGDNYASGPATDGEILEELNSEEYHSQQQSTDVKALSGDDDAENHERTVWLCCDVYDTGIGIPEKALPILFKKYMQASTDHARKYGGTGLGLAICKQLVELMGGDLTLASQEGRGSTFTFVLPYKVPSKEEYSDDPNDVVLIDDNEVVADIITDETNGSFVFKPRALGATFFPDQGSSKTKLSGSCRPTEEFDSFNCTTRDMVSCKCISGDANNAHVKLENRAQSVDRNIRPHGTGGELDSLRTESKKDSELVKERVGHHKEHEAQISTSNGIFESPKSSVQALQAKILLVEDNKVNVMVAQSMLKQLGYCIDVAHNGLEAIRAFQRSRFDLILMDVCMPEMDGLQATRLIRSFEEHGYWDVRTEDDACGANLQLNGSCGEIFEKRTPIIAMTANALAESVEDCLASGMDSFVPKPVTFEKLKQCLQQYMHG